LPKIRQKSPKVGKNRRKLGKNRRKLGKNRRKLAKIAESRQNSPKLVTITPIPVISKKRSQFQQSCQKDCPGFALKKNANHFAEFQNTLKAPFDVAL
jgi:hypothetical protein